MARPRKDSSDPGARARIIEAFWALLEGRRVDELSVGMIAERAHCNRGTFYYHFKDLAELERGAIGDVLDSGDVLHEALWRLMMRGEVGALSDKSLRVSVQRMVMAMRAGALDRVEAMTRKKTLERWRSVACDEGQELSSDAMFAIEFMFSGVMALVISSTPNGEEACGLAELSLSEAAQDYLRKVALATTQAVARAQGIDVCVLANRIESQIGAPSF